nr:MAG TPA: hypothetical protein [Caudoviricetes sp.]
MAKFYDIAERMRTGNEKPTVSLDENHVYKINTSKSAVLMIHGISGDEKINDVEKMDKIILTSLGKEAADYINEQDYTLPVIVTIVNTVMAAVADVTLEEIEEMSKEEAKKPGKKSK